MSRKNLQQKRFELAQKNKQIIEQIRSQYLYKKRFTLYKIQEENEQNTQITIVKHSEQIKDKQSKDKQSKQNIKILKRTKSFSDMNSLIE